jgi:hypothetical protein
MPATVPAWVVRLRKRTHKLADRCQTVALAVHGADVSAALVLGPIPMQMACDWSQSSSQSLTSLSSWLWHELGAVFLLLCPAIVVHVMCMDARSRLPITQLIMELLAQ